MATDAAFLSGGYDKGFDVEGVATDAKKVGSSSSSPSSESCASTMATRRSFRGGGDKGIVIEGVVRAVKKVGSLSSSPSSESPQAPVGIGSARGGGDVGVPHVRPAKQPIEEAMLVVPGVKG